MTEANGAVDAVKKRRMTMLMTAAALGLFALAMSIGRWRSKEPRDFYQFWAIGQAVRRHNPTDIYSMGDRNRLGRALQREAEQRGSPWYRQAAKVRTRLEPAGTPFLYAVFSAISVGEFDRDYRFFRLLSGLCYVLGLFYFTQIAGLSPGWGAGLVLISTRFFYPFRLDIATANVNQLQIGYLALLIELSRRRSTPWLAAAEGALLSVGFFFKPTIAYVGLFIGALQVFDRRWQRLGWQIAGFAATTGLVFLTTELMFGKLVSWENWFVEFRGMVFRKTFMTQSMAAMVLGTRDLEFSRRISTLALVGVLALIGMTASRSPANGVRIGPGGRLNSVDFEQRWMAIGLGLGVYLATSPLVHGHYFTLMLPVVMYFLRPAKPDFNDDTPALRPRTVAVAVGLFMMSFHPFFEALGYRQGPYHNMWTYVGSMIFTGMCAFELFRLRRGR